MAHRFTAELIGRGPGGAWTVVAIPADVTAALAARGQIPVSGTLNGHPFRSSLIPQGDGTHAMHVNKEVRAAAGFATGDMLDIELERDAAPRTVTVPAELAAALRTAADARAAYDAMSYSHRKEYADWIATAKREETRQARAAKAVTMLRAGKPAR